MFGELVAAYLFLAGVGAGGIAAASLADLAVARASFAGPGPCGFAEAPPAQRLVTLVLATSVLALGIGAACLTLDLGRIDRLLTLFTSPSLTLMNVGAWALAALLVVGLFLALMRFLDTPGPRRSVVAALEVVALVLAVVVAVYAGLLLQTLAGVRLWSLGWVPVLFVASALACGLAVLMVTAFFRQAVPDVAGAVDALLAVDAVLIAVEAVVLGIFLVSSSVAAGPSLAAVQLLVSGRLLPLFWIGVVCAGLVVPFSVDVVCRRLPAPVAVALGATCTLVGGLCLRIALLMATERFNLAFMSALGFWS